MMRKFEQFIDYFVPAYAAEKSSNVGLVRTFIMLHLVGPLLGQSITGFLYLASPSIDWVFWVIAATITAFWTLPFAVKYSSSLVRPAILSVTMLMFVSLFGSYFFGGASSPFLPWLLVALLLGFFYLADRPLLVVSILTAQLAVFATAYSVGGGFPEQLPLERLSLVNMVSIGAAAIYMTIMAVYYESVIRESSQFEVEANQHRDRAQHLREAMELAEKASLEKSIFLAKMSHELRTPLNAVIGYSEMLIDDIVPGSANVQKAADLRRINAAGRHLLALVTDVLDLSRIESEIVEIHSQEFAIADFIDEVVATSLPLVRRRGNRLDVQLGPNLGSIVADPLKLRQSVLNLIGNAAKFTNNGRIVLSVMRRHAASGDQFMIEVRDTGIGISKESLTRLFQDYNQAENDTSRTYGGTGLGLALTRRFCHLMGGTIVVESEIGQGSSFKIQIPATTRKAVSPIARANVEAERNAA
jgi:signal transduction histidine kinase